MDEKRVSKDTNPATLSYNWATLSPYDWSAILSAMFTCEGEKVFYENFSKELSEKEYLCRHGRFVQPEYCYQCKRSTCQCQKIGSRYEEYLEGSYLDGIFVPVDQVKYNLVRHIQVHEELSNPDHWGHLGWMFVEFMQSRDGMNKSMSSCRQHNSRRQTLTRFLFGKARHYLQRNVRLISDEKPIYNYSLIVFYCVGS